MDVNKLQKVFVGGSASGVMAAALVVGVGVPPAQAKITKFCTQPFAMEGEACFCSDGDRVAVNGLVRDGLRAVAQIRVGGTTKLWECHDANGARNGLKWCNFD